MTVLQYVRTPDLLEGDLVLNHGMQIRLGEKHTSHAHSDGTTTWFAGTVENAEEICDRQSPAYDAFIASFLRGGNARDDEQDQWCVQGNELALWTVDRADTAA